MTLSIGINNSKKSILFSSQALNISFIVLFFLSIGSFNIIFEDVTIQNNNASFCAGGIIYGSASFYNVIIENNNAEDDEGAGLCIDDGGNLNMYDSIVDGNNITVEAELFSLDGSKRFYEKKTGKISKFREIGKEIGQILKTKSNNSYKK